MNILDKVHQTPLAERPLIDLNGLMDHMDDDQFAAYLEMLEKNSKIPAPAASLEEQISELRKMILSIREEIRNLWPQV